jgi:hypothetical protein
MPSPPPLPGDTLPSTAAFRVDAACDRFEAACHYRRGSLTPGPSSQAERGTRLPEGMGRR